MNLVGVLWRRIYYEDVGGRKYDWELLFVVEGLNEFFLGNYSSDDDDDWDWRDKKRRED